MLGDVGGGAAVVNRARVHSGSAYSTARCGGTSMADSAAPVATTLEGNPLDLAAALEQLQRFHEDETAMTLAFDPAVLSAEQRNTVRIKAVALGHTGKSKGGGMARHLVISKAGAPKKDGRSWQQQRRGAPPQVEDQPEAGLGPSLVTGDNEDPQSSVVFLRKIPRSVGRLELTALGSQFGASNAAAASCGELNMHDLARWHILESPGVCGLAPGQARWSTQCCCTGVASASCSLRAPRRRRRSLATMPSARS